MIRVHESADAHSCSRALAARLFVFLVASMLACAAVLGMSGCKDSDTLKDVVYSQDSDIIDYDNPTKFLVNDPTAKEKSEAVSSIDKADSSRVTEEEQNVVVYSSKPNTEGYKTKSSVFDYNPSYRGIESNIGVRFKADEKQTETPPEPQEDNTESDSDSAIARVTQSESDKSDDSDDKKKGSKKGKTDEDKGDGEGTSNDDDDGAGSGDEVEIAADATGAFTDPPEVEKIAAFGEYAVIVQAVGGKGALAATDRETLKGEFSTVFAKHGAADIATGWKDDGETAEKMDVDAIIKSGADTILVPSSKYGKAGNGLSKKDVKKLNKAGVTMTVVYALTNSTYLLNTVETVGKMLAKSKSIEFDPKEKASAYKKFHNDLVDKCVDANGGLAGTKVYELKNKKDYKQNADARYTLLVDEYDTSARFTKKTGSVVIDTNGVGVATFNYSQTPVSYYIQAGGLVNTGASKSTKTAKGTLPVWQFNTNIRSFKKDFWSYDDGGAFDASDDYSNSAGWDLVLTTIASERSGMSVGSNIPITGLGASFGSPNFPRIIAGTQQVKDKMIENSKAEHGLYHAYSIPEEGPDGAKGKFNPATYGLAFSSTGILFSSIGVDGTNGLVEDFEDGAIPSDAICVNPHGLFDSWLEGTLEACLEAAWVTDVVNGEETVGYEDCVKDFYKDIYDYSLSSSELSQIEAGVKK